MKTYLDILSLSSDKINTVKEIEENIYLVRFNSGVINLIMTIEQPKKSAYVTEEQVTKLMNIKHDLDIKYKPIIITNGKQYPRYYNHSKSLIQIAGAKFKKCQESLLLK